MKRLTVALGIAVLALLAAATPAFAAEHVSGKVVTSSGAPAASVWVVLTRAGDEKGRALTGDDGKYYIGRLASGRYTLVVKSGDRVLFRGAIVLPRDRKKDVQLP